MLHNPEARMWQRDGIETDVNGEMQVAAASSASVDKRPDAARESSLATPSQRTRSPVLKQNTYGTPQFQSKHGQDR